MASLVAGGYRLAYAVAATRVGFFADYRSYSFGEMAAKHKDDWSVSIYAAGRTSPEWNWLGFSLVAARLPTGCSDAWVLTVRGEE